MKKQMKSIISLFAICAITAILLALTNYLTVPFVKANEEKAVQEALKEVMEHGADFTELDISAYDLPDTVIAAYGESGGGYVLKLSAKGFSPNMIIMCGVNADGTVSGATCLSSEETLGYEKTYGDNFKGLDADSVGGVDAISGATKTTAAYRAAIVDAIDAANTLKGGN